MVIEMKNMNMKNLFTIVMFDIGFILVTVAILKLFYDFIVPRFVNLNKLLQEDYYSIDPQKLFYMGDKLGDIKVMMRNELIIILVLIIIAVVLFLANWSFFQGLIYSKLAKKKFNLKYFLKFSLLSFVFFALFIVILGLIQNAVNLYLVIPLSMLFIILFIYYGNLIFLFFAKDNKIKSIKNALRYGTFEFYKIAIQSVLLIVALFLLMNPDIVLQYLVEYSTFFRFTGTILFFILIINKFIKLYFAFLI